MVKRKQGFALMDPARVREIASMGGKKAHTDGRAHQWTSEEARRAGQLSVIAKQRNRRKAAGFE